MKSGISKQSLIESFSSFKLKFSNSKLKTIFNGILWSQKLKWNISAKVYYTERIIFQYHRKTSLGATVIFYQSLQGTWGYKTNLSYHLRSC